MEREGGRYPQWFNPLFHSLPLPPFVLSPFFELPSASGRQSAATAAIPLSILPRFPTACCRTLERAARACHSGVRIRTCLLARQKISQQYLFRKILWKVSTTSSVMQSQGEYKICKSKCRSTWLRNSSGLRTPISNSKWRGASQRGGMAE